jgi:hypothetical protein
MDLQETCLQLHDAAAHALAWQLPPQSAAAAASSHDTGTLLHQLHSMHGMSSCAFKYQSKPLLCVVTPFNAL